jgi:nucleoside-diphosphate-sugar epimerase
VDRADVVFHLAGNTSAYAAAADPAASLESTVLPVTHLIAAAASRPGRRVVYASTATVYGMPRDLPVAEDTPTNPVTVYDLHKLCAEQHLALASRRGLLEGVSLRLSNVYGPSPGGSSADDRGVLNRAARLALQGEPLRLYGGGNYVRDYVYIDDVIAAFLAAGLHAGIAGMAFNVASGVGTTIRAAFHAVADMTEEVTGRRNAIEDVPWPPGADPIECRDFTADIRALAAACAWRPAVALNDGLGRLVRELAACPPSACS